MKKCISLFVVLLTFLAIMLFVTQSSFTFAPFVSAEQSSEEKIYCNVNINDDFADDKVLVVLTKSASLQFKKYSPKDFANIGCKKIEVLTRYTEEQVKAKIEAIGGNGIAGFSETPDFVLDINDFRRILLLELKQKSKQKVIDAIRKLERRNDIMSAEPGYAISACADPYPEPQHYEKQREAIDIISLPAAWDYSTGESAPVIVGVIDSGIDASHPDLSDQINAGLHMDFTGDSPVSVATPTDISGHGTHVAGIIGAGRSSGVPGITGVCRGIKLVSLKIFGEANPEKEPFDLIKAIDYATGKKIPILNFSGGYPNTPSIAQSVKNYPGLLVCSAGNSAYNIDDWSNTSKPPPLPAAIFPRPKNLITVGNSTDQDKIHDGIYPSNYGKATVDLFAPGVEILSAFPTSICTAENHVPNKKHHYAHGYHIYTGTSMSAPFVTGVAALIKSKRPLVNAAFLKKAIVDNVDPVSALSELCITGGRLNAYKAVKVVDKRAEGSFNMSEGSGYWTSYKDGTADVTVWADTSNCPKYYGYPSYNGEFKAVLLKFPFEFGSFETYNLYFGTMAHKVDPRTLIVGNYYYMYDRIALDAILYDCSS